jgi:hypothetical protein
MGDKKMKASLRRGNLRRTARLAYLGVGFLGSVLLNGCNPVGSTWASSNTTLSIEGRVSGGNQPIIGSTIQVYMAGTSGTASSAQPLLAKEVLTDSNGKFSITDLPPCVSSNANVYVVATGGNPGLSTGTNNTAISLMSMLGPCGELPASTSISVNEVTTVGSVSPVSSYMTSLSRLGSASTDSSFSAALTTVTQLVDTRAGVSPGTTASDQALAMAPKLNTLADVIAACVNSTGGVAGDGSYCGSLFSLTTPPDGVPPTDTATAAL